MTNKDHMTQERARFQRCGDCKKFQQCYNESSILLGGGFMLNNDDYESSKYIPACEEFLH